MKKYILFILVLILCIPQVNVFAQSTVDKARILYDLGLLKGTNSYFSESGLELSRNATRAEACTTIVRMLGKEEKANYQQNPHPFMDVPQWADNYVGWLYENYLVNGSSDTYFGANDIATVQQFSTMLLRVLGYEDKYWDFTFDTAVKFAKSYGLIDSAMANHYELSREDMIIMCYNALKTNIKNSNRKLIRKLCDEGAVNEQLAQSKGLLKEATLSDHFADVPKTLGTISVKRIGKKARITFRNEAEEYGLRVYIQEEGGLPREVPLEGDSLYMKKGNIKYYSYVAAGYVNELTVYGLDSLKTYSFIVIKTTSESELYQTTGKSSVAKG